MTPKRRLARTVESDPRWALLKARDRGADDAFVYAVVTTGVYCRPSCGARLPRPENVRFFARGSDAQAAGFRPCKRCKADAPPLADRQAAQVAALCRIIESREDVPSLDELAEHIGASRFHTQRTFKRITGVTPRQYAAEHRGRRVKDELRTRGSAFPPGSLILGGRRRSTGRVATRPDHAGAALVTLMSAIHLGDPLATKLEKLAKAQLERRIARLAGSFATAIA